VVDRLETEDLFRHLQTDIDAAPGVHRSQLPSCL
jgi:hypothetical protein